MNTDFPTHLWPLGTSVHKRSGSFWRGRVVGFYTTRTTPVGYVIESDYEPGAVQLYPVAALERDIKPEDDHG